MCLTVSRRSRDLRSLSRDHSVTFHKNFANRLKHRTFFKRCSTVGQRSRDLRPLSRDRSVTFFKLSPNCLNRRKNVVWQSADGRVTSDHCRVTVQWLFSIFSWMFETYKKTLFDSRPTVAWPTTTVAWPTTTVTVQWLFTKFFLIAWNVRKTLFDSRPTVAWPPTTVAWPFSDFFQNFSELHETYKNVVWQSADGRVTSDHRRVTVQRLFSKFFQIAWNVEKSC